MLRGKRKHIWLLSIESEGRARKKQLEELNRAKKLSLLLRVMENHLHRTGRSDIIKFPHFTNHLGCYIQKQRERGRESQWVQLRVSYNEIKWCPKPEYHAGRWRDINIF